MFVTLNEGKSLAYTSEILRPERGLSLFVTLNGVKGLALTGQSVCL